MNYKQNDFVIFRGGKVCEVIEGPAEEWLYFDEASCAQREALRRRANARAFEIEGLAYEVRNLNWLEPSQNEFDCVEVSDTEVAVTTPLGRFFLKATRARRGDLLEASVGSFGVGISSAKSDQVSLPVQIYGRLNAPHEPGGSPEWRFQASFFRYDDGSSSNDLGAWPMKIRWEVEPEWPAPTPEERARRIAARARELLAASAVTNG